MFLFKSSSGWIHVIVRLKVGEKIDKKEDFKQNNKIHSMADLSPFSVFACASIDKEKITGWCAVIERQKR